MRGLPGHPDRQGFVAENRDKIQELFQKRISIVGEISALNAQQLQNSQRLLGNGIDLQRCTENMKERGDTEAVREEYEQACAREENLQKVVADCEDRLADLERQVAELDRKLEEL